jgi:ABC-type glycerol-3-phosphate transport system substrate-binding protein
MKKKMMLVLAGITAVSAAFAVPAMAEGVTLHVTTTYSGEDSNMQNYKDSVAAW